MRFQRPIVLATTLACLILATAQAGKGKKKKNTLDSFNATVILSKVVIGRKSRACNHDNSENDDATLFPDSVLGTNYEIALAISPHDGKCIFEDDRYNDKDYPAEYGMLTSAKVGGLSYPYFKVGKPAVKATAYNLGLLRVYFKPIYGIAAYNVFTYTQQGDFKHLSHVSQASVEASIGRNDPKGKFEILPPSASVSTILDEEAVLPGEKSAACRKVDGVRFHNDAIIEAEDIIGDIALVELPQSYEKGKVDLMCWGGAYADSQYPARKVSLRVNAPHANTSIVGYQVDAPLRPATSFAASPHALYFRPLQGVQPYQVWSFDDESGYFEVLSVISGTDVEESWGKNIGVFSLKSLNISFVEDESVQMLGKSRACRNVDGAKLYDDADINPEDTIGDIAIATVPQHAKHETPPQEWTGGCWGPGAYGDGEYPVSRGAIIVAASDGAEMVQFAAYSIGGPNKPAREFRASHHGIYVKVQDNVAHKVWKYADGGFKFVSEISADDINAAEGKNSGFVYAKVFASQISDEPFFILPSTDSPVDQVKALMGAVDTGGFVQTTIKTSEFEGKTIFVLPESVNLNEMLHENFNIVDGGYVYAGIDVNDIGNDPFIIVRADQEVSIWPSGDMGVQSAIVSGDKSPFVVTGHRFPINEGYHPFDAESNWAYGPQTHEHKYSTAKRFLRITRGDGALGIVWQDEASSVVRMTWFQGDETTSTQDIHSGADSGGIAVRLYGASSDGDASVFFFVVSRNKANKDVDPDINGENYVRAVLIKCDAYTGNIILARDASTLAVDGGLNIARTSDPAGSLVYRPPVEGEENATLGMIIARNMWNGHQGAIASVWDANTLNLVKILGQTSGHSFANRLSLSKNTGDFIGVDLGDNFPRGIHLHSFNSEMRKSKVVYSFKTHHAQRAVRSGKTFELYEEISTEEENFTNGATIITCTLKLRNSLNWIQVSLCSLQGRGDR